MRKQRIKTFALLLTLILSLSGCGEENQAREESENYSQEANNEQEKTDEEKDTLTNATYSMEGFLNAGRKYDDFNSYASENGLDGTLIYVEGKVLRQNQIQNTGIPVLSVIIEQQDGKQWCVAVTSSSEIEEIQEKEVRVFGTYQGFSDVENLPAMGVFAEEENIIDKARIQIKEGEEYKTIWSFHDYLDEEMKNNTEKTPSNLYSTEELSIETVGEIEYRIPRIFLENTQENGEWKYFYYQDLTFCVCCSDTTMTNKVLIENSDEFVNSLVDGENNGRLLENTIEKTDVGEVIRIQMERTENGEEYVVDTIAFCKDSKFYSFMFMGKKSSEFNYSEDFQCLIKSIKEKDDVILYEDERVKIYFKEIGERGVEFWVENLTDVNITIQADSVSINGISSNNIIMSDDVAPKSRGKVIAKCDDFEDVSKVETVGGQLRIIDFDESFKTYKATFINVEVE